jgi:hypothetical protein
MKPVVRISRSAYAMKPAHGEPCNRCGACCEASVCPLGQRVLGLPFHAGPCPALSGEPGETSCGLIAEPARYSPVRTATFGADAMRTAAKLLINASDGCCARFNGEPVNHAFNAHLDELDRKRADAIKMARVLWD